LPRKPVPKGGEKRTTGNADRTGTGDERREPDAEHVELEQPGVEPVTEPIREPERVRSTADDEPPRTDDVGDTVATGGNTAHAARERAHVIDPGRGPSIAVQVLRTEPNAAAAVVGGRTDGNDMRAIPGTVPTARPTYSEPPAHDGDVREQSAANRSPGGAVDDANPNPSDRQQRRSRSRVPANAKQAEKPIE
jgi:hypothetical protein